MAKPQTNQGTKESQQIRVSIGSAISLGLLEGKLDAKPTTTYLMTYLQSKCTANCGFCPQARDSQSKAELLSRVSWPVFSINHVVRKINSAFKKDETKRVCIQAINYPTVFNDLSEFIQTLKSQASVPVSVSCQPLNAENLWNLARAGTDHIGIAIDAASEQLFQSIKGQKAGGPYKWEDEFILLRTAVGVFGEGNVTTHIIVGLGETEKELAFIIQKCVDMGVFPALFAFNPVRGTKMENTPKPQIEVYRRAQLIRYLIVKSQTGFEEMNFNNVGRLISFGVGKDILKDCVESGEPFLTSGCPGCNRPFYNEKPSGPLYNYPRNLTPQDTSQIKLQIKEFLQ